MGEVPLGLMLSAEPRKVRQHRADTSLSEHANAATTEALTR